MRIDYSALKAIIDSEPANADRDGAAVARWINAPTVSVPIEHRVDDIGIMRLLGGDDGAAFLDAVNSLAGSVSKIGWAFKSISDEGLNLGDTEIRAMLDTFAADPAFTALDQTILDKLLVDVLYLEDKAKISVAQQNEFGTGLRARHINKARAT